MRYGFIKAAAATPEIRVADCSYNAGQTVKLMREASEKGVKLLVFPELCITGYTCSDLFLQRRLLDGALTAHCNGGQPEAEPSHRGRTAAYGRGQAL